MRAFNVSSSQRRWTFAATRALATSSHIVGSRDVCTMRFSTALHADG